MSSESPPDLHMLNVVARDMAASLDFCRRLGIAVPAPGNAAGADVQLKVPGGCGLELDTAEPARLWHAAGAPIGQRHGGPGVHAARPAGGRCPLRRADLGGLPGAAAAV